MTDSATAEGTSQRLVREALAAGWTVVDDDDDDPMLLNAEGEPVDTWREGYPYDERLSRREYEHDKRLLQIEMLKLLQHV